MIYAILIVINCNNSKDFNLKEIVYIRYMAVAVILTAPPNGFH